MRKSFNTLGLCIVKIIIIQGKDRMKSIKDYYNKTCSKWAEEWYPKDDMLLYLKHFINKLPKYPKILDLCCGAGYESMRMNNLGAKVIGLDFSEESIKIAKEKNPDIDFFVGDMLQDFSYLRQVDGIVISAGLVHLPNEKLRLAFKNCWNILKPNGSMLLVVRDGSGKRSQQSYVTIDGENYDREFYAHSLQELMEYSTGLFKFDVEILPNENDFWKKYIFQKVT